MGKMTKILLIIAVFAIILGSIVFICSLAAVGWDFNKLQTGNYVTNEYVLEENFDKISIDAKTTKVEILPSEDGKNRVVSYERLKETHKVSVEDGELKIKLVDTRKWYERLTFNFTSPKLTVYLAEAEYNSLSINISTGDVNIASGFTFGNVKVDGSTSDVNCCASVINTLEIEVSTGEVEIERIAAGNITVSVSTGDIDIEDVTVTGKIYAEADTGDVSLERVNAGEVEIETDTGNVSLEDTVVSGALFAVTDTGNVRLDRADASSINIETDTGNVSGTLLSEKIFIPRTDTGSIRVPETVNGGICKITTDTGDIKINIVTE